MRTLAGQGDVVPEHSTDSFLVFNLSGEYAATPWAALYGAVQNLTDERYVVARQPAGVRPGLPRTISWGSGSRTASSPPDGRHGPPGGGEGGRRPTRSRGPPPGGSRERPGRDGGLPASMAGRAPQRRSGPTLPSGTAPTRRRDHGGRMNYTRLGETDLEVSRICFGTWQLGGEWGPIDVDEAITAIRRALELGINFFDTAQAYGFGVSEARLAEALRPEIEERRDEIVLATKGGLRPAGGGQAPGRGARLAPPGLEESLRHLHTDYVDLYQVHWPDDATPPPKTGGRS
jgi:hypothetical protein